MKKHAFGVLVALSALQMSAQAGFLSSYVLGVPTGLNARSMAGAALGSSSSSSEGQQSPEREVVTTTPMYVSSMVSEQTGEPVHHHCGQMSEQQCKGNDIEENEYAQKNKQLLKKWRLSYEDMVVEVTLPAGASWNTKYQWQQEAKEQAYDKEQFEQVPKYDTMDQLEQKVPVVSENTLVRQTVQTSSLRVGQMLYKLPVLELAQQGGVLKDLSVKQTVQGVKLTNTAAHEKHIILTISKNYGYTKEGYKQKGFSINAWSSQALTQHLKEQDASKRLGKWMLMIGGICIAAVVWHQKRANRRLVGEKDNKDQSNVRVGKPPKTSVGLVRKSY